MVAIVNYIKFVNNPNYSERVLRDNLDRLIYSILKEYKSSYYVWFGYDKLFYNSIYKYEKHNKITQIVMIRNIFKKFFSDINTKTETLTEKEKKILIEFLTYIYPINERANYITSYSELYLY